MAKQMTPVNCANSLHPPFFIYFLSSCVPDLFSESCVKFSQLIADNSLSGGKKKTYRHAQQNLHNRNNDFKIPNVTFT